MTNKDIANVFKNLAAIMELHNESAFKTRSYNTAYVNLRRLDQPVAEMDEATIGALPGVGKAIKDKIIELLNTGNLATYQKYAEITPPGIIDMLSIKGLGPKKVKVIWEDMEIETVGELLYACNENRLSQYKGFGLKTQEAIKQKIEYYFQSQGKFRYGAIIDIAEELLADIRHIYTGTSVELTGDVRRKCNTLDKIEILIGDTELAEDIYEQGLLEIINEEEGVVEAKNENGMLVVLYLVDEADFVFSWFYTTASEGFRDRVGDLPMGNFADEAAIFDKVGLPYFVPEMREEGMQKIKVNADDLVQEGDIKGVVHSHTTYSDGIATLTQMAAAAKEKGYSYIGITDHSQTAFYANGLKPDRLLQQIDEIDQLNTKLEDFTILKGIESDILGDGRLDYEQSLLDQLDFVIASVHANLNMDQEKATKRIIAAVEHPSTSMLGHPTGRLLLSRKGYPLDHKKVIDACAANQVSIEINASPYRLDIDWRWIPYCMEKGVRLSINPDAHSIGGIDDIAFGVASARKGGLTKEACLNTRDVEQFLSLLAKG
jgi:DNA polymerase (family 10)